MGRYINRLKCFVLKPTEKIAQILLLFKGAKGVFVLFLFLFVLNSCKKQLPHYSIDSDVKAAFNYQPGTYWIYRDSITGRIDSFYVTQNVFQANVPSGDYTEDAISINIIEKDIDANSVGGTPIQYYLSVGENGVSIEYAPNLPAEADYILYNPFFIYPFQPGAFVWKSGLKGSSDESYCMQIFTSYTLNGQVFSNVAEIPHGSSGPGGYLDTFFVNADVFIAKMKLYHPYDSVGTKVWELQRWHIVK